MEGERSNLLDSSLAKSRMLVMRERSRSPDLKIDYFEMSRDLRQDIGVAQLYFLVFIYTNAN